MPYVPVPKDLTAVKSKVAFNLTKRQLICFSLAALSGGGAYFLTRKILGTSGACMLLIVAALPFFLFAMYEKNGQPLEKVLKQYITAKFIKPQTRPYRTENIYSAIMKQSILDKEVERIAGNKEKTKNPQRQTAVTKAKKADSRSC